MARSNRLPAALLLLACTGLVLQAAAMPMHPELLEFLRMPVASSSDELQQTAARKLQQADGLFSEGGGVCQHRVLRTKAGVSLGSWHT